jgi:inner membrane transporter RhtA
VYRSATCDATRLARIARRAPPESFFVGSAVFHYLGPAFAVLLFALVQPLGVAWLRIVAAAAVFALWRRPWRVFRGLDGSDRRTLIAMGVVLAVMNACFYLAIDRLPLGTVAAIEFLPVIALAAVGMRNARNVVALASAVGGVYLLTDVRIEGEPLGVAFAFANAALFALYIVVAHRVARTDRMDGIDGLGAAMLVAAIAITPIGARDAAPALLDPIALLAGLGVGISSSVIPYVFDQLAMARLSRATYSLMVSLLPATATVIGLVVLSQVPSSTEIIGVGLVVAAVAVHRTPEPPQPQKVWSAVPHRRASHATISPRGDRSHRRRSHELSQNGTSAAGERGFPSRRRGS